MLSPVDGGARDRGIRGQRRDRRPIRDPRLADTVFVTPRAVAAFTVLVLAYLVVVHVASLSLRIIPIDFYQYWGASAARRVSTEALGSPYREARRYGAALLDAATRSGRPMFQQVSQYATPPNFTATPFVYTLFALLPATYTEASLLYYSLQIIFFLAAVIVVGVVYRYPAFPLLCLALLLILASGPLNADLRLGNLGCLQFIALAILLALADRLRDARPSATLGGALLSGLTLLVLTKPNVALVLVCMVLHLWVARGTRFLLMAAWPAVLCGGAAVILSSLHFGSWTVWQEWSATALGLSTVGSHPSTVERHLTRGNYSTPLLLGSWLHLSSWASASLIAVGLATSTLAVVGRSVLAEASARAAPIRAALARALGDPHLAMAVGITLTIALPPLVWFHYYVIALIPSLWLLNVPSTRPAVRWCGLVALVLSSGLPSGLFLSLAWNTAGHVCAALSWLALWAGVLVRLSESDVPSTHREPRHRPERRPAAGEAQHRRRSRAASRH